jgi:hypothetical protein
MACRPQWTALRRILVLLALLCACRGCQAATGTEPPLGIDAEQRSTAQEIVSEQRDATRQAAGGAPVAAECDGPTCAPAAIKAVGGEGKDTARVEASKHGEAVNSIATPVSGDPPLEQRSQMSTANLAMAAADEHGTQPAEQQLSAAIEPGSLPSEGSPAATDDPLDEQQEAPNSQDGTAEEHPNAEPAAVPAADELQHSAMHEEQHDEQQHNFALAKDGEQAEAQPTGHPRCLPAHSCIRSARLPLQWLVAAC